MQQSTYPSAAPFQNRPAAILVVGDVMTDVIAVPDGPILRGSDRRATIRSRPGGSGANQAVWLAAMDARVYFAARVGASDRMFYDNYFRGRNVVPALTGDPDLASGVLVTLVEPDGERSFLTDRGANLNLSPSDVPDSLLDEVGMVMISGYAFFAPGPRAAMLDLLARARAKGLGTAIDPASTGFLAEVGPDAFLDWTAGSDIVFANADEATLLTGQTDPGLQMQALGAHYATVVLKRGAEGALVGGKGGILHGGAAPRVQVVDSTGAGDAFAAGFLAAWLSGVGLDGALDRGLAAGARAVTRLGGQPD